MTKKSRQKFKYLENEKSLYDEIKRIFRDFQMAYSKKDAGNSNLILIIVFTFHFKKIRF